MTDSKEPAPTVDDITESLAKTTLKDPSTLKGDPVDDEKTEETITMTQMTESPQILDETAKDPDEVSAPSPIVPEKKEPEEDRTNLIINYLPPTMSEGTLATLFSPYGLLERCKIVVDLQTLRSRGYGFVKYDNQNSAERAMKALNGYELNGKKLKVAFARQQCKAITNANLYITNIPSHFENDALYKLFQDYGKIIECRVLKDQNGQSRGVGFVRMDTHHNAIQALQAMDQYVIDDKHPPLLVKLAQRRVPRRYWNNQNRGGQGMVGQGGGRGGRANRGGRGRGPNKRRQYQQKTNRQQAGGYGAAGMGAPQMAGMELNPMGGMGGGNRNSPSKRGFYRPRQQYGKQGQQQKGQYTPNQQRRQPNQGFPTAMYPQYDAPYGMAAPQYPQAAYAPNMHLAPTMNAGPSGAANPSSGMFVSDGGGVNGHSAAPQHHHGQQYPYLPEIAALSAAAYQTQ